MPSFIQQSSPFEEFDPIIYTCVVPCAYERNFRVVEMKRLKTKMSSLVLNEGVDFFCSNFYRVKIVRLIPHVDSSLTPLFFQILPSLNFTRAVTRSFNTF